MSEFESLVTIAEDEKQSSYRRRQAVADLVKNHQGDPKIFNVIKALMDSGDDYFKREMVTALRHVESPEVLPLFRPLLALDDEFLKRDVIQILAKLGNEQDLETLKALCDSSSYSVSSAAKQAFETLSNSLQQVEDTTEEPEPEVDNTVEDVVTDSVAPEETPETSEDVAPEETAETVEPVAPEIEEEPVEVVAENDGVSQELLSEERDSLHDNSIFKERQLDEVHQDFESRSSLEYSEIAPALFQVDATFDTAVFDAFFKERSQFALALYNQLNECQKQLPIKEQKFSETRRQLTMLEADKSDDIELSSMSVHEESEKTADIEWKMKKCRLDLEELATENQGFLKSIFNSLSQDKQEEQASKKKKLESTLAKLKKELSLSQEQLLEDQTEVEQLKQPLITLRQECKSCEADRDASLKKIADVDREIGELYCSIISGVSDLNGSLAVLKEQGPVALAVIQKLSRLQQDMKSCSEEGEALKVRLKESDVSARSASDHLGVALTKSFKTEKRSASEKVSISANVNFKEESSFFGGYSNASGAASGKGSATLRYDICETSWQPVAGLNDSISQFRESFEELGADSVDFEILTKKMRQQQSQFRQYVDYIRVLVESSAVQ